ncbi:class I glutamine amidotransferase-like protein [Irpex rosettiformis]|uniref:Class I glutamine amidotransferase-like protein n=1 Tax=Irpex rosettiformis TaxID=378272 RepID=A0ACB8U149_9APHY|nr:class I glutamine amidotransferase-like protein [Irpex rosettiformis]
MPTQLALAVCIFPRVCPTDFQGPIELLSFLDPQAIVGLSDIFPTVPDVSVKAIFLGVTSEPVQGSSGPKFVPDRTYSDIKDGEQFDIILVPGGLGTRPGVLPEVVVDFVKKQAPGAKYVLSVCSGSEVLARADILNGLRATTNKSLFKVITEDYKEKGIKWVPKARWVVDGKIWTASGVTAGADMGYAFLRHLAGDQFANAARGIVEYSIRGQDDDEFAEFYGLV